MTNRYLGVDPMLTDVAIAYSNDDYIADLIFPEYRVAKQSGKHFVYDRGAFRVESTERAAGANSKELNHNVTVGTPYFAEDHSLREFVPDEDVKNAITPTSPFIDATEFVTHGLLVAKEKQLADMLRSTTIMTQNITLAGTDQWSDYSNLVASDPIGDIQLGMTTIHGAIYMNANTLILGRQVWDRLKNHPNILARVQYTQKAVMTADLLASLIGVDRVLIGGAGFNQAKEGQTDSMTYIWGKDAILCYIAPVIRPKMMTLGFTYLWENMQVERLRGSDEEDRKGTYVRVGNYYYQQKLVSVEAGYLIKNAVA